MAKNRRAASGQSISYDRWRKKYVRDYRGDLFVEYNGKKHQSPPCAVTASEATGYGMLISVLAGNQEDFDGFLRFYHRFVDDLGLMHWQLLEQGHTILPNPYSLNSATDGDMDIALALLLAAEEWSKPEYKWQALKICNALLEHCFNPDTKMLTPGDWCKPGHPLHLVARTSDFLLSHLAKFAQEDAKHAAAWTACLEAALKAVEDQLEQNPTGLMADFVGYNGAKKRFEPVIGKVLERDEDQHFFFNACRTPWRLAIYYAETGSSRVLPVLRALTTFFEGQAVIYAGYTLAGVPLVTWSHVGVTAPVACLFKVMKSEGYGRAVAAQVSLDSNYFGDSIQLLCELQTEHLLPG